MKLFKTGSIDVVKNCLSFFVIDLPSCVCKKGKISPYCVTIPHSTVNSFCKFCSNLYYLVSCSKVIVVFYFLYFVFLILCYLSVNKDVYITRKTVSVKSVQVRNSSTQRSSGGHCHDRRYGLQRSERTARPARYNSNYTH